jgi:hypothetical protein
MGVTVLEGSEVAVGVLVSGTEGVGLGSEVEVGVRVAVASRVAVLGGKVGDSKAMTEG